MLPLQLMYDIAGERKFAMLYIYKTETTMGSVLLTNELIFSVSTINININRLNWFLHISKILLTFDYNVFKLHNWF